LANESCNKVKAGFRELERNIFLSSSCQGKVDYASKSSKAVFFGAVHKTSRVVIKKGVSGIAAVAATIGSAIWGVLYFAFCNGKQISRLQSNAGQDNLDDRIKTAMRSGSGHDKVL
jgi:hypothetical protein